MEPIDIARLLVASIRQALARGCKHYDAAGQLLATDKEIVECLLREGGVVVQEPGGPKVPT